MTAYWELVNWNNETFRDGVIKEPTMQLVKERAEAIMPKRFEDVPWEDMPAALFAYKKLGRHHFYLNMKPFTIPTDLTG